MVEKAKLSLPALLVLSAVLLAILVPGGPVETRSFANIPPFILGAFNTFLTTLGMFSLVLAYFVYKARRWAYAMSFLCGLSYLLVYVLDLGTIFPVSPDPMPPMLLGIELAGTVLALPLMMLSLQAAGRGGAGNGGEVLLTDTKLLVVLGLMVLVGVGIIVFATHAAMRQ